MDLRRSVPLAFAFSAVLPACNPYHNRGGEYLAGSVDPVKFAKPYQGAGYSKGAAFGTFMPIAANYKGGLVAYYSFPFGTIPAGTPFTASDTDPNASFPAPLAYAFDPTPPTNPFPAKPACKVADGYVYDERRDGYRLDEQGNIMTDLPNDPAYLPIVSEVAVKSAGEPCQDVKSAESVTQRSDVTIPSGIMPPPVNTTQFPTGKPDGNFLAWAIIDPSADVFLASAALGGNTHDANTGLGSQRWGWFDHFLLAYLDGGYIPTLTHPVGGMMGNPDTQVTELQTQILYVPDTVSVGGMMMPGTQGMGFDIMQFKRDEPGYSPICHVIMFTPTDPTMLPTSFTDVTAANIKTDNSLYIACLQVK